MSRKPSHLEIAETGPIPGARQAAMPSTINPMLPTLITEPFSDPDWIFETKWDGYRAVCFISDGKYRLVSRNQVNMTAAFPEISEIAKAVNAETAVIDGELVAFQPDGLPSFQLLQGRLSTKITPKHRKPSRIIFYVFDLIYLDGFDLQRCALVDRKHLLKKVFKPASFARYSDHIETEGIVLYEKAAEAGLEGIVAKKKNSHYVQGRTKQWLKIKPERTVDVVICGYTDPQNSREYFGGLVTGVYGADTLVYCGRVGSGFSRDLLEHVFAQLQPLATPTPPFAEKIPVKDVRWVKPTLVATVKYLEWTQGGELRHPVFLGLRSDKEPKECKLEQLTAAGRK